MQRAAVRRTRQDPRATPAPDLVNRQFSAVAQNRLWVADATRIPCGEGAFWLAAVRDAFSRRTVGWKTSDRCDTDLVLGAFEYGVWSRDRYLSSDEYQAAWRQTHNNKRDSAESTLEPADAR